MVSPADLQLFDGIPNVAHGGYLNVMGYLNVTQAFIQVSRDIAARSRVKVRIRITGHYRYHDESAAAALSVRDADEVLTSPGAVCPRCPRSRRSTKNYKLCLIPDALFRCRYTKSVFQGYSCFLNFLSSAGAAYGEGSAKKGMGRVRVAYSRDTAVTGFEADETRRVELWRPRRRAELPRR